MNEQINQMVQAMATVMLLGMTAGVASPMLFQRGNGHPPAESEFFAKWLRYGVTTRIYSLLPSDEVPIVTKRLKLSGRYVEADAAVYIHNNTGMTIKEFCDHFEDIGLTGNEQADILSMLVEHGIVTIKEASR